MKNLFLMLSIFLTLSSSSYAVEPEDFIFGPYDIPIRNQALVHLSEDYAFLPAGPAAELLAAIGNQTGETLIGLILSRNPESTWSMQIEYIETGYISDAEAAHLDKDDLLNTITENTVEDNKWRIKQGVKPLNVIGWAEAPFYDEKTRSLIWSISAAEEGAAAQESIVNYNIKALGREGLVSMTFVTGLDKIVDEKYIALGLAQRLTYNDGKKYEDFNAKTDQLAAFGLGALITGVAVKKTGIFAALGLLAAKFAKVIGIAIFAGIAGFSGKIKNVFKKKDD